MFELVTDKDTIRDVFRVAHKKKILCSFWLQERRVPFDSFFSDVQRDSLGIQQPSMGGADGFSLSRFEQELESAQKKVIFGTLRIENTTFFFELDCLGWKDGCIYGKKPEKIFRLQRRKSLRVRIPLSSMLEAYVSPNVDLPLDKSALLQGLSAGFIVGKMYDLSTDGIGVDFKEQPFSLEVDQKVSVCFRLSGRDFFLRAAVKNWHFSKKGSALGEEVLRLGLAFDNVTAEESDLIKRFIQNELRYVFSTLEQNLDSIK